MSDIFRKPTSGEPFRPSARQTGAFIDAAREVQTLKGRLPAAQGGTQLLLVENATGEDIPWFGVVEISDSVIDPTANEAAFKAGIVLKAEAPPSSDAPAHRIGIAQQPIPDGKSGLVMLVGVTQVQLNNPDGASYEFARVVDADNAVLMLDDAGNVPVVWHVLQETGENFGLVVLPGGDGGTSSAADGLWIMSISQVVADCSCRVAWCLILRTPCGDNRWLPGDLVLVYDDLGCVLNDTAARLAGAKVVVCRTEGDAYTANSLGEECRPYGYDPPDPGACHFTFVRRCCLEPL